MRYPSFRSAAGLFYFLVIHTDIEMRSTDCIEEIRDVVNQIEFYVELKLTETPPYAEREVLERRYQQDIGRAIAKLVELRLEGALSDQVLDKWHSMLVDHSDGLVTAVVKLTDRLKSKYN
jgi:hypothetical protein